jgi:mono/diheme cytochrome c family protein
MHSRDNRSLAQAIEPTALAAGDTICRWRSGAIVMMRQFFSLLALLAALVVGASAVASGEADLALGRDIYNRACIACHGADGAGAMPGVPDFTDREGPLAKADAALAKAILKGVEGSTAPTPMPPKGGDPNLTETDVRHVLGYIRTEFGRDATNTKK